MRGTNRWILALLIAVAVVAGGCSLFDNNDSSSESSGQLSVFLSDAPGNVTELWVKLDGVTVYPNQSSQGTPLTATTQAFDLIATVTNGPQLGADFSLPEGSYRCLSGTLTLDHFVVGTDSCTKANGKSTIDFPMLCTPQPFLVSSDGTTSVLVDLPITSGSCDPVTQDGTLSYGTFTMSMM